MTQPMPTARLARVTPYARHVPPPGIDLWLDLNEGRPWPGAADALAHILADAGPSVLARYPRAGDLEADLIAEHTRARESAFGPGAHPPLDVVLTAGGDDALYRLAQAFLEPGRAAIVTTPSFEMIPRYCRLAGCEPLALPWREGPFPTDALLQAADPTRPGVAFVVSPNNPTGLIATAEDLTRLSAALPHWIIVADLAYTEFAEHDLTALALTRPNVVAIRTFSKAWGLAGLRVGYAVGPAPLIAAIRAAGNPFSASGPSLALIAAARLHAGPFVRGQVERVRTERDALTTLLRAKGASVPDSHANFVLARLRDAPTPSHADPADRLRAILATHGIAIRAYGSAPDLARCVRITCPGEPTAFDRLTRALHAALPTPATPDRQTERPAP